MARPSVASRRCSRCSIPAPQVSPWSTLTTDSAPPPPRVASTIRKRTQGRARRWIALALQVAGLSPAVVGAWRGSLWAMLAAAGGAALAVGWTIRWRPGRLRRRGPPPLGLGEVLDLLRQAYSATAGWGVGGAEGPLETGTQEMDPEQRRRGAALVQLASVDGRLHVVRDPEATFVAVGDFPYAAGLALPGARHATTVIDEIAGALRRFVAGMRVAEEENAVSRARIVAGRVSRLVAGAVTLEGIARAAVEMGEQLTHRAVALVVTTGDRAQIIAVSAAADRRLTGLELSAESPVAHAIATGLPVATRGPEDLFGLGVPGRRRSERAGIAYPLLDGALRHVRGLLEAAVRDGDVVARIGGEEFAVWLPGTPLREGMEVAERIRRSVAEKPLTWTGTVYPLTTSCGLASYPQPVGDLLNLPAAADAALYRAKQGGRNRVERV